MTNSSHFRIVPASCFGAILLMATACLLSAGEPAPEKSAAPPGKPTFEKTGPQPGDQLPDLNLRTLKGEPQHLGDAWRGGPALIVTSSFTCPKSRSRWPELKAIADKYGEKLNVAIVYVIEAHPVGSVCPYKGIEEVTPENERDGILRHQPKTLDDRLDLAREFKRYLRIEPPIYIDTLDNQAWKAFGAAPNKAFLVDQNGIVMARQGWFDGKSLQPLIDPLLTASKKRDRDRDDDNDNSEAVRIDDKLKAAGFDEWKLLDAIEASDPKMLQGILSKVPEAVKSVHDNGRGIATTMLMEAVRSRNSKTIELLLNSGADIDARTRTYDSALQFAAELGRPEIVKLLLRHHADPNRPAKGATPLHMALIGGHTDVALLLIDGAAKPDFYSDAALGNADKVRQALAADPSLALRPDGVNHVALDYAAANGRLDTAKLLIDAGAAPVDDELSQFETPLQYAIQSRSLPMIALLLDHGHSPNTAVGWRGESASATPPLDMAIATGDIKIVKLLLSRKPDLKRRNTYSQTPLHYAAENADVATVELLLQAGADPYAVTLRFSLPCGSGEEETPQHDTPLHFAAARGKPAVIQALLKAGAKIEAKNVHGNTPLLATVEPPIYTGNDEPPSKNIETLLAAGANVNAQR